MSKSNWLLDLKDKVSQDRFDKQKIQNDAQELKMKGNKYVMILNCKITYYEDYPYLYIYELIDRDGAFIKY